jgi:DNA-binding MarR family transcriptional regulator
MPLWRIVDVVHSTSARSNVLRELADGLCCIYHDVANSLTHLFPNKIYRATQLPKLPEAEIAYQITHTLLRVINKIEAGRRVPRQFGKAGSLTLIEAEICQLVARNRGITGSEIAKELGVTHSAISQVISKLRKKGLIFEEYMEGDAKRKLIYLTAIGKSAAKVAQRYYEMMQSELFGTSNRELLSYLRFVSKLENFHSSIQNTEPTANPDKPGKRVKNSAGKLPARRASQG